LPTLAIAVAMAPGGDALLGGASLAAMNTSDGAAFDRS
jgi:hypothetical protein